MSATCAVVLLVIVWEIVATAVHESRMTGLIEKERRSDQIKEQVDNYARSLHPMFRNDRFKARSEDQIERDIRAKGVPWSLVR